MPDVDSLKLKSQSPKKVNSAVRRLLSELQLPEKNIQFLKYKKPDHFRPESDNCHFNVLVMCNYHGGGVINGWIISQDTKNDFIEAQFHAVWSHPDGTLVDITPRKDGEKRLMFVLDELRQIELSDHEGIPAIISYDNFRILRGITISGLQKIKIVPQSSFIYDHGLAIAK